MRLQSAAVGWRMFFVRLVVASAVLLVLWQTSLYFGALVQNRQSRVVVGEAVYRAKHGVSSSLAGYASDLMILAGDARLQAFAGGDASQYDAALADFMTFVRHKAHVAQLRFLDHRGMEVLRIDRGSGGTVAVARDALQDKSDRYYFTESIKLPTNTIYASSIDLNVEHGEIETPWRPMFRLATPIEPAGPDSRGVVILNINAGDLLAEIRRAQPTEDTMIQFLNSGGYWLAGVPSTKLWGFMFGQDTSMAVEQPGVWERLSQGSEGEFDLDGEHYLYRKVYPIGELSNAVNVPVGGSAEVGWTIMSSVPNVTLFSTWRWNQWPVGLGGLILAALIAAGWTRLVVAHRNAEAERLRAEKDLMRNERLASLGSLVAGVAHELNTPIGSAVTIASTLGDSASTFSRAVQAGSVKRSELDTFLGDMRTGTAMVQRNLERANELIGHFKQVAVDQTSERRRKFHLGEYIRDIIGTIEPQFKHTAIRLETDIVTTGMLNTYPGPLAQILINLVSNARIHGFDEGEAGVVTIRARDADRDAIEIVVEDTGKGIPEGDLKNIFEPFFTTKLGAGGSGLGLSIVYNTVENVLGGTIRVSSVEGKGTSMIIRLPKKVSKEKAISEDGMYHVDKFAA